MTFVSELFCPRAAGLLRLSITLVALTLGVFPSTEAAAVQANPTTLTFQATIGSSNPPSQTINLSKTSAKQVNWTSVDNANWLNVAPGSGRIGTSTRIMVSVNISGLAAGSYKGNVLITLNKGGSVSIPVALTVAPAASGGSGTASTTGGSPTTITWAANTENDLAGYRVYVGTSPGSYDTSIDVGKVTSYSLASLKSGVTYYFTVTAYDTSGNESIRAVEVSKSIY
jgi:hypothetical protein